MATIFKINPDPTFRVLVGIPVAGRKSMPLDIEFRHKTRDELKEYSDGFSTKSEIENLMDIVAGWRNCDAKFDQAALELLLQNYSQASNAIIAAYTKAVTGQDISDARLGN